MILRVFFHLMIVRFFFSFIGFLLKLAAAVVVVIALQVVVGEQSLEQHLESVLKNSSFARSVKKLHFSKKFRLSPEPIDELPASDMPDESKSPDEKSTN